ncbi:MAG: hypothetical protein ACXACP_05660 [Candidatus Hodarchaeales archaeon]
MCNTQHAGVRPFGVSLLIAGVDEISNTRLFMTEPSGSYWGYRAAAIGSGAPTIIEELETSYEKEAETIQAGFHVALRALKKVSDDELDPDMIEIAIIPLDSRKLSYLNSTDIINLLNEL